MPLFPPLLFRPSGRSPSAMLLTIPTELQFHIVSFLPRGDMAAVARTCQHFYAVTLRDLSRRVELRSLAQADAFFLPSTIFRKGSPAEIKHAESKRAQWEAIKVLVLRSTGKDRLRSRGTLPKSLRGPGVEPINLDELQFFPYDDDQSLIPLLQCFNPRSIQLATSWGNDTDVERSLAATGWKDVTQFTLYVGKPRQLPRLQTPIRVSSPVVLSKVRYATLVDRYPSLWERMEPVFRSHVVLLLRLCPNLDGLKIVTRTTSTYRSTIEELVQGGVAGKPASFFSVELETETSASDA